jgi:signal transduction histidine kinase
MEYSEHDIQEEIFLILQELLVNTKKHSKADRVVIKFSSEEGKFHLKYSDNGTGLDEKLPHNNGLQSIQQRTNHIKGILYITQ